MTCLLPPPHSPPPSNAPASTLLSLSLPPSTYTGVKRVLLRCLCALHKDALLSASPRSSPTLTIPITPRPPETAVFITEPLLCAANEVFRPSIPPPLPAAPRLGTETKAGERQGRSAGQSGWSLSTCCPHPIHTHTHVHYPSCDLVEVFTCGSRRSAFVVKGAYKEARISLMARAKRVKYAWWFKVCWVWPIRGNTVGWAYGMKEGSLGKELNCIKWKSSVELIGWMDRPFFSLFVYLNDTVTSSICYYI